MRQTPEAEAFLTRIISLPSGPGVSLDNTLQPSLDDESELRKLFATDKSDERLKDPHVGLVDVFAGPVDIRTTRARIVTDDEELSRKFVMPLSETNRRKEGTPSMVNDLEEFKKNWSIFTEGSLSQLLDWNNVVAAGGAVLACITPLSEATRESKRSIRKYYHSAAYPSSDVDLFLWGLNPEQAEKKINTIYEAVRDSVPWDVTCVRTKHTVSIHSQYPYRSVQIVLRLYSSPAEILAGFDIDAPCCLYNGERVLANPRAIIAMMRQCNTVDMTRRSPSYEIRLSKYSGRGFEVYVPTLERKKVDPTIYERSIARIEGLARLLVLEKLVDTDTRYAFLESRRNLRGRPNPLSRYFKRKKYKGDLKVDTSIVGLEMNDYDVATLHIPYGPGWDARRIDKLVYQTDLGMNSTFNPKNKGRRLHRHPAFFGNMMECLEDCCEHCPVPVDADERTLQAEEDSQYIRGRISFMEEDPGRQSISGSFNPIDVGEWSEQVYIGETEQLFAAIAAHDAEAVTNMITREIDINRRDHVGRTALHVAILCKASDIACILIEAGARITPRLVDGRSSLHLAAQLDQLAVVRKLLERSAINQEQAGLQKTEDAEDVEMADEPERPSSEDDWSSEDDDDAMDVTEDEDEDEEDEEDEGGKRRRKSDTAAPEVPTNTEDFPEDQEEQPDILDVNIADWDLGYSPLAHAVVSGSLPIIEVLLTAGADPKHVNTFHDFPLNLTILRNDEAEAAQILERLLLAGVSSSTADPQMHTIFHRAVVADKLQLVSSILRCDPNAKMVLDFPSFNWQAVYFPIVSSLTAGKYAMLALLLAHGVKLVIKEEDVTAALDTCPPDKRRKLFSHSFTNSLQQTFLPVESAISAHDDVAQLLVALGADVDLSIKNANYDHTLPTDRRSIIDWVRFAISMLAKSTASKEAALKAVTDTIVVPDATLAQGWRAFYTGLTDAKKKGSQTLPSKKIADLQEELVNLEETRGYFIDMERLLAARGAKGWNDLYPDKPRPPTTEDGEKEITTNNNRDALATIAQEATPTYSMITRYGYGYGYNHIPQHLQPLYDELYEACFMGDNEKIQQLCLPPAGLKTTHLLDIYVQITDPDNRYYQTGHTPLFAAISGRRWSTAKLIMAIASAQHRSEESEEKFTTYGINLDDDSDNESDDSDDSDITVEQETATFFDVANRPSAVQTDVHPKRLLDESNVYFAVTEEDGKQTSQHANLVNKAIREHDFEAFINIMSLYKSSAVPVEFNRQALESIIQKDQADMLDEYIRITGFGIDVKNVQTDEDELLATNDKDKIYLGLSVHGKKRKDLAKMNDPNATRKEVVHPLLWRAALQGSKNIVEYLSGDRPLAAYRFYAASSGDEFALQLRRIPDLDKVLPQWLGWTTNSVNESPLTAAAMGGNLQVIKLLFSKKPRFMASSLHQRIKFIGYNALMLAISRNCDTALVDYLLAKSVSPAETDPVRGWNIYHLLCTMNFCDLLEHFLHKLPRDVNEALLAQQSKGRLNTPLHHAVKNRAVRATKLIVDYTKATLLLRDVDGSTPLHSAIQRGCAEISSLLIASAPPEILYMENGVGETPLEMASLKHLQERAQGFINSHINQPSACDQVNILADPKRISISRLEMELPRLRSTIQQLITEGRLIKKTKTAEELSIFADMMDVKLVEAKAVESAKPVIVSVNNEEENKNPTDGCNRSHTLAVVLKGIHANPGKRQLVHLIDVQKSVQGNLAHLPLTQRETTNYETHREADYGLKNEEDSESREREGSMVLVAVRLYPDTQ